MSAGVPQDTIHGRTLWDVFCDGVLRIKLPKGCKTVADADKVRLLAEADNKVDVCFKTNLSFVLLNSCIVLAPHKTEAVIFKGKRNKDGICFTIEGTEIKPQKCLKCLTVRKNQNEKGVPGLARLMSNIDGPFSDKWKVLAGVSKSIIMYGTPIGETI